MLRSSYPYYVANRPVFANEDLVVTDKYTGQIATRVAQADEATIDRAIAAAVDAAPALRCMPAFERKRILEECVARFETRREEFAGVLCIEAGKPIRDARAEVTRLIETFRFAAEEATRQYGEVIPFDVVPRAAGYTGYTKQFPVGPCAFISPFNFPLNLTAHKVAPAIAAGCPFVLKPASLTPVSALLIAQVLAETSLPPGSFSVLPCPRAGARLFAEDPRLRLLSFTGSPEVGWALKARAGQKKVTLELGGNAACIVDETADLEDAAARIVNGAFFQSGQSCISVQRVLVHATLYERFRERVVALTQALAVGNPQLEETRIGPLITRADAERLQRWVAAAVAAGARVLCGGTLEGSVMHPTWLENVPPGQALRDEEAFGPVALLSTFTDFGRALDEVNASRFGLQAGVFTRDIYRAQRAWDTLEVGGVLIGEVPSFRVDHMPYGGVKDSGLGREGVRWAIRDMTETRLLVVRTPEPTSSK